MEEGFDLLGIGAGQADEPIERGARLIVAANLARSLAFGPDELDRRLEQVHVEPQLVSIEIVHRLGGFRRLIAVPADELADVGPVLLLDMGVVVLLVRPTPGEADLPRVAVAEEMMVDELAAVVGVDIEDLEGQDLAHLREGLDDPALALPQDGPGLDPGRSDVGQVERVGEEPLAAAAAVRDRVELQVASILNIPVFTLDGDLVAEQGPGPGPAVEAPPQLPLLALQGPVDRPRTDPQELALDGPGRLIAFPDRREPHVGGDRKGAKSGSGGVVRKTLSPRLSSFSCSRDTV